MSTFPQRYTKEGQEPVIAMDEGQAINLRKNGWVEDTTFVAAAPTVKAKKPVARRAKKK